MDPKTAPLLEMMQANDGAVRVSEQVYISSLGSAAEEKTGKLTVGFGADANGPKIGPEFTFGLYMEQKLNQPILIIKTAWGGKSLHTDFRPPSAGPYPFREEQREELLKQGKDFEQIQAEKEVATGRYYRLMIEHVKSVLEDIERVYPAYDGKQGYQLAGFVWFQGWNDMVDRGVYPNRGQAGGYDAYSEVLADFIRDVRRDLAAPELPFVIGVLGVGGPVSEYGPAQQRYASIHQNFRDAMAAPAKREEFKNSVTAVLTEKYWDQELQELRGRDAAVQKAVRQEQQAGELTRDQAQAELEERRSKTFTERERKILEVAVSNFEFHYLGSAKIMAQIGKGFAEAMLELMEVEASPAAGS